MFEVVPTLKCWEKNIHSPDTCMVTPIWSCEGQPKSVGGFGACSQVPFVLKEYKYINWDTLELDIQIPDHYIDTSNFTL